MELIHFSGPAVLSLVESPPSEVIFYSVHTRVLLACPLVGGLSSFGVCLSEVSLLYVQLNGL